MLSFTVVGLTTLGAAGWAIRARAGPTASPDRSKPPRIVVLPFENLGAPTDEYFADGMTDELMGRLARLPGLAVIGRTSAIQYRKTTKSITQIAKELRADFLVEGTVRWEKTPDSPGRVRITPQVVRGSDGTRVWNDTFDKEYGPDIFSIQSDIAEHVTRSLDVSLRPSDERVVRRVPTTNLAAYDAYARAVSALDRDFGQDWDAEQEALQHLELAVRLDSGFADAHARLAALHWSMPPSGYDVGRNTGFSIEQRWEWARASAMRAIAADSASPLGHAILALYYGWAVRDTARERQEFAVALRSQPSSPDAIGERAGTLADAGRFDDALSEAERAKSLDPRNPHRWGQLAGLYRQRGDLAASGLASEQALGVAPNEVQFYLELAWNQLARGRREDASVTVRNAIAQVGVNAVVYKLSQSAAWVDVIRMLPEDLGEPTRQIAFSRFGGDTIDYYLGKIRGYYNDRVRVKAYYDSVLTWAQPRVRTSPRDSFYRFIHAWALAGSGRQVEAAREVDAILREEALAENKGKEPLQAEVFDALNQVILAQTCVMIGRHDCAVEQIARAIAASEFNLTPAIFRLDPVWDPLRKRDDFRKLVEGR